MLSNVSTSDILTIVLISSILLFVFSMITASLLIIIKRMKDRMDDMSRMVYTLIRKNDIQIETSDDIKQALSTINGNLRNVSNEINGNIGSLSSSTNQALKELKTFTQVNDGYYPTPNISKMMRDTILECINVEVLLNKNMRIPNPNSSTHIIETVINTYPNVNKEYTTKLCMAMIENFIESSKGVSQ